MTGIEFRFKFSLAAAGSSKTSGKPLQSNAEEITLAWTVLVAVKVVRTGWIKDISEDKTNEILNDGLPVRWKEREPSRMIRHIWPRQLIMELPLHYFNGVRKLLERKKLCVGRGKRETKGSALDKLGLRYLFHIQ